METLCIAFPGWAGVGTATRFFEAFSAARLVLGDDVPQTLRHLPDFRPHLTCPLCAQCHFVYANLHAAHNDPKPSPHTPSELPASPPATPETHYMVIASDLVRHLRSSSSKTTPNTLIYAGVAQPLWPRVGAVEARRLWNGRDCVTSSHVKLTKKYFLWSDMCVGVRVELRVL